MSEASDNTSSTPLQFLQSHLPLLATATYLLAATAGLIYHFFLIGHFDQSLLDYWEPSDFLIAGFREPVALLMAALAVIIAFQIAFLDEYNRWLRRKSELAYKLVGSYYLRKLYRGPLPGPVFGVLLGAGWFLVIIWTLATAEAVDTWNAEYNDVRIEFVDEGGAINGRLLAVSNRYHLLLVADPANTEADSRRFMAIPIDNVLSITRCAAPVGVFGLSNNPCQQRDRLSAMAELAAQADTETQADGESSADTPAAPVQEQSPQPYRRNRLIKEPDF
ncbi:MAG: hypothetical protein R3217_09860 [Gammaproteobacteria bacterium]|nr:hypothetical protein [Gammaproteobacteria bacterium]